MKGSPNEVLAKSKAEYTKWETDALENLADRMEYVLDQPYGVRNRAESEIRYKAVLLVLQERRERTA